MLSNFSRKKYLQYAKGKEGLQKGQLRTYFGAYLKSQGGAPLPLFGLKIKN